MIDNSHFVTGPDVTLSKSAGTAQFSSTPSMSVVSAADEVDMMFIQKVQEEVTQSCALPFALPVERIPAYIKQAADYFYLNSPYAFEIRNYIIPNNIICKCNVFNKIITLPDAILSVFMVHKMQEGLKYGALGDFSVSRMVMNTYSMFGGVGSIGGGMGSPQAGGAGYELKDVVTALYEVSTFDQTLNPPLTFNYNTFSHKLVLLGDMGRSDIIIECCQKVKLQDLYNDYYFFRFVVCLCKRSLSTIYNTFSFKLPGGIEINISDIASDAKDEMDEIKEWLKENQPADYFFQPNTM